MIKKNRLALALTALTFLLVVISPVRAQEEEGMRALPVVKLQSLDKVTARTMTFEANVGSTVKFGPLFIKAQTCKKSPSIEKPESASFLQVWEIDKNDEAQWIFSGWMFASSPGLSSMDHPIYDVWVIDCLEKKGTQSAEEKQAAEARGEGEMAEDQVPQQPEIQTGN